MYSLSSYKQKQVSTSGTQDDSLTRCSMKKNICKLYKSVINKRLSTDNSRQLQEIPRNRNPFLIDSRDCNSEVDALFVRHGKITQLWSRSNGEAERMMDTLDKLIRECQHEQTS